MKIFILLLICFISVLNAIQVVKKSSGFEVTTENIEIIITGGSNVPKFTVKRRNGNNEFDAQFHRLYQSANVDSTEIIPASNIALASLSWTFSDWVEENQTVSFNLTTTGNSFGNLQFSFHIDDVNSDFKFDVNFDEVPESFWKSDAGAIVLSYKIQRKGSDATVRRRSSASVDIGDDAYMEVKGTANSREDTKSVVTIVESPEIYNTYERFEGVLQHDPKLGFKSDASKVSISVVLIFALIFLTL